MTAISANISQTALEGLNRAKEQATAASGRIVAGSPEVKDIVSLKTAEHAFKASATVFGTEKRLHDRLLDIFT